LLAIRVVKDLSALVLSNATQRLPVDCRGDSIFRSVAALYH
jgi:hypothetical protein